MEIQRGRRPGVRWRTVTRGAHLAETEADRLAYLRAWQTVLPASAVFSHLTAAWVRGWWLPPLPADIPVFTAAEEDVRVRRPGLRCSRHTQVPQHDVVGGLRVTTPRETLLTAAADLGVLDLVVLADGALDRGVPVGLLEPGAGPQRRGLPRLRAALAWSDSRAESPWESVLRVLHHVAEVPVVPQHQVWDDEGFVARGDLWIDGTRTLQEYDGGVHRSPDQHRADLARDRALARAGWRRNGYTAREVVRTPWVVLRDADDALGRDSDPRRLDRWKEVLSGSLFGGRRSWTGQLGAVSAARRPTS